MNVALSDARNGRQLWAESYDRELTTENLFAIQGDIASQVAGALRVRLSAEQQAELAQAPTSNLAALDFYHRALALWDTRGLRVGDSVLRDLASRAVALDSGFVAAWGLLSQAETWLIRTGREVDTTRARNAMDRVHALAPGSLEDRLAAGYFAYYARGDYAGALKDVDAAAQLLPNSSEISILKALLLRRLGRWDESEALLQATLVRDPRNLLALNDLAVTQTLMRQFREADENYARFLAISPTNPAVILRRFLLHLHGFADSARARDFLESSSPVLTPEIRAFSGAFLDLTRRHFAEAANGFRVTGSVELGEEFLHPRLGIALAHHYAGDRVRAAASADTIVRTVDSVRSNRERRGASDPFGYLGKIELDAAMAEAIRGNGQAAVALGERGAARMPLARDAIEGPLMLDELSGVYILANQPEKALALLEKLLSIPSDVTPGLLRFDPLYDPLRSNPRFQALLDD